MNDPHPGASAGRRTRLVQGLRLLAVLALGALYLIGVHLTTVSGNASTPGVLLSLGPLLLLALALSWRSPLRKPALGAGVLLLIGLWQIWPLLKENFTLLLLAQHLGANALLALLFGRTLLGNEKPLCTALAETLHEDMPPTLARYTRQVTIAWTLFFVSVGLLSILLYLLAPRSTWSTFANLMTMPLVGLMFAVEYLVRCRVLPPEQRATLVDTVRAFQRWAAPGGRAR